VIHVTPPNGKLTPSSITAAELTIEDSGKSCKLISLFSLFFAYVLAIYFVIGLKKGILLFLILTMQSACIFLRFGGRMPLCLFIFHIF
jgi:hypothetical protein